MSIKSDRTVVITLPQRLSFEAGLDLVQKNWSWVVERMVVVDQARELSPDIWTNDHRHYIKHRDEAKEQIRAKLEFWNGYYGFVYQRVSIRNQSSRWGSCSSRGNLNFNYKLIFLPEELFDYVVVHELCHLRELNHSQRFWALVAETLPAYREYRSRIKTLTRTGRDPVESV